MTQRNFKNDRNMGDGPKGVSRKSASSAKIKSKAGSSVYVRPKNAKNTGKGAKGSKGSSSKSAQAQEQMRMRERAMGSMAKQSPAYKRWRRVWAVFMGIAIGAVIISWVPTLLIENGVLGEGFSETASWISIVAFIFALVAIAGAFYVDLVKIRKIQKAEEAKAHNLSKTERDKLDKAIQDAIDRDEEKRQKRKSILPWSKNKAAKAEEPASDE